MKPGVSLRETGLLRGHDDRSMARRMSDIACIRSRLTRAQLAKFATHRLAVHAGVAWRGPRWADSAKVFHATSCSAVSASFSFSSARCTARDQAASTARFVKEPCFDVIAISFRDVVRTAGPKHVRHATHSAEAM